MIGCLIFIGHFPQNSRIIHGSFAKNDLQLKASCESSPPCRLNQISSLFCEKNALFVEHPICKLNQISSLFCEKTPHSLICRAPYFYSLCLSASVSIALAFVRACVLSLARAISPFALFFSVSLLLSLCFCLVLFRSLSRVRARALALPLSSSPALFLSCVSVTCLLYLTVV